MTISTATLKNAAFAIEHDLFTDPDGCNYLVKDGAILRRWEPEHDDGDSLRLAVGCRLVVHVWDDGEQVSVAKTLHNGDDPDDSSGEWTGETNYKMDIFAATRRAIVLAAAKIGATINRSPENH